MNSDRRLFAHELEEKLDTLLFASPSHRSISRLAHLLEALPRSRQDKVLHWAGIAARTYAEIGYLIATLAPQAFDVLGDEGFEAWVLAGLNTYDKEGLRPAMERLRNLEALRAERAGLRAAYFADVEPRLTRWVRGLSGRPLALKAGEKPWTDTETLYLPPMVARFPDEASNRQLYKAMLALLWAQRRFGTFQADLVSALADQPDESRALGWLAALEAVRLEACIARELPSLATEIAALRGTWPAALRPVIERLSAPQASIIESLTLMAELQITGEAPALPHAVMLDPATAQRVRAARIEAETQILRQALAAWPGRTGCQSASPNEFTATLNEETRQVEVRCNGEAVTLPPEAQAAVQSLLQDLDVLPPEALTPAGNGAWRPPNGRAKDWRANLNAPANGATTNGTITARPIAGSGAMFSNTWFPKVSPLGSAKSRPAMLA